MKNTSFFEEQFKDEKISPFLEKTQHTSSVYMKFQFSPRDTRRRRRTWCRRYVAYVVKVKVERFFGPRVYVAYEVEHSRRRFQNFFFLYFQPENTNAESAQKTKIDFSKSGTDRKK